MSKAISKVEQAMSKALAEKPKAGGFPYLAECLRRAGITRNLWFLPACESIYLTGDGPVVNLRIDQAGGSTFPEFLAACYDAGVVRYNVDLEARTVAYYGCLGQEYLEGYPAVAVR